MYAHSLGFSFDLFTGVQCKITLYNWTILQNMEVLKKMGKYTGITSECAIPMDSTNYMPISKRAPITAQIVIGTPGTINKWITARKLSMSYLKILVFDEADHMLAEVLS